MEEAERSRRDQGGRRRGARDGRRPARRVGERPARGDGRAGRRPPQAALLRPRNRRGDRCVSLADGDRTMAAVTVLDGSTFVVCDERGDLDGVAAASGFFAADTRFLSRSVLTVDGERADAGLVRAGGAARRVVFELRGPTGLAMRRELFVGRGLEETITVENRSDADVEAVLELELASDFADIFAVKRVDGPRCAGHVRGRAARGRSAGRMRRRSSSPTKASRRARSSISLRRPTSRRRRPLATGSRLEPGARWQLARRGAVAAERDDAARRRRVRAAAARRPARARRVARGLVALGAAAAGAGGRDARADVDALARRPRRAAAALDGQRDGRRPPGCRGS